MTIKIISLFCCVVFAAAPLYGETAADLPQTRNYSEAKSLSYLQRAYFSLEQALFYTEKSKDAKQMASFDYGKLLTDIGLIEKDLGAYLYPRNEKLTGEQVPFKIDGDYFLEDIINAK